MYTYTFGGKNGTRHVLHESTDMVAVRTRNSRDLDTAVISEKGKKALRSLKMVAEFPEADITVFRTKAAVKDRVAARNKAKSVLKNEPELRFVGKVLVEEDGKTVVLYTENIFIKFHDDVPAGRCEEFVSDNNLKIKQKTGFAENSYFVSAPEDTGLRIFEIAESLLQMKEVELCHPELIRRRGLKRINARQWHLMATTIDGTEIDEGVRADLAHKLASGGTITIALIDDGFDIDHPEFSSPGKVVHSRDISSNSNDPRPRNTWDNHGTACAGIAAAKGEEASGVAPGALLMPVRLSSSLGSMAEANAFLWAADHGADVISCSWGPEDGNWSDPGDPVHTTLIDLPDSTRLAIDYAVSKGRGGLGCVIAFAAGNGNEDCSYDGYASYPKVMAVAACNDRGKRCIYSDYGKEIWCSFPSSDLGYEPFNHPEPLTPGIYTTDRTGRAGYNSKGDYTDRFGGTSGSCPGAAGTAALILSVNQNLTWEQVRRIIRDTCDKIDLAAGDYDSGGHSNLYGFGRINAEKAVLMALSLKSASSVCRQQQPRRRKSGAERKINA